MPGIDEKGIFDTISEYWKVFKNKVSSYFSSEEAPVKKVHEKGKPDDVSRRIYLKDMDENMINPVIKNEMIEEMSQAQTEQYIDAQKQSYEIALDEIKNGREAPIMPGLDGKVYRPDVAHNNTTPKSRRRNTLHSHIHRKRHG
jgi:hypothetical protein